MKWCSEQNTIVNGHSRCCEGVMVVDYSPKTVGAYRIRPDVSEREMIAANKTPSFNGHPRRRGGRMRYAPTYLPFVR